MPPSSGNHPPSSLPLTTSTIETASFPTHAAQYQQQRLEQKRREAARGVELEDLVLGIDSATSQHHRRERSSQGNSHTRFDNSTHQHSRRQKQDDLSEQGSPSHSPMGRRARAEPQASSSRSSSSTSASSARAALNGRSTGKMNSQVEMRRKNASLDSPTAASQTANLMSRASFSLDHDVPVPPSENPNHSFWDLSAADRRNFLLLVLLYFLQGIPMGLASGSVPFLLKPYLSYGQIGIFSLASYPYSLKLLWSPIVDAVWSPKVGRRKSWILPIQLISGIGMIWLGGHVKEMMVEAGANNGAGVWGFTWAWFFLVFMCATQDIAVDGWAITLLSSQNLSYASTAQTVGLTGGQFLSYTVFLALNAPDFANRWFRQVPSPEGVITLGGYLKFWGWAYLIITVGLALLKKEERTKERDGIMEVYRVMVGILKLKNIQSIIILHLTAKIGFQANDAVTNLKLLEKGFSQEDMALTVLIDFPFEMVLGYYGGKWSSQYPPMKLWCWAFVGRLIAAVLAQVTVMIFPSAGVKTWYLVTVIAEHVFSTSMSTIMFVAVSAFHAKIADPVVGGTYMTLLATVSNLGGTLPRFFVLKLVDIFTVATCQPPISPPVDLKSDLVTSPFSCALEAEKHRCENGGGTCNVNRDGYYIVNVLCIIIGLVTFLSYIRPAAIKLQSLPLRAWRLVGGER